MVYDPQIHHRRSIRLKGYDYSQIGFYFVTICIQNREYLLGEIVDEKMQLNDAGVMVNRTWNELAKHYDGFKTHEFVVMPNHIHGTIEIAPVGAAPCGCPDKRNPQGLADIVHRFKTLTTTRYIHGVNQYGWPRFERKLWQRNYWEHIIRNEDEARGISEYIHNNPERWAWDKLR